MMKKAEHSVLFAWKPQIGKEQLFRVVLEAHACTFKPRGLQLKVLRWTLTAPAIQTETKGCMMDLSTQVRSQKNSALGFEKQ